MDPVKACSRRLREELRGFQNIVLLGPVAVEGLLGERAKIMNLRGFPVERPIPGSEKRASRPKIFPTIHPYAVTRQTKWRHVFRNDVSKAFRYFAGGLAWVPPVWRTSDAAIRDVCASAKAAGKVYLDVETDGLEPLTCHLRCVGLGVTRDRVAVVPYRLINGGQLSYPSHALVKALLQDPAIVKIGHNAGNFDRMVLEANLGIVTGPWEDTLLKHHVVESELPHSLQYLGSVYTDVHQWKAVRGGLEYESDQDLYKYNAADVSVTIEADVPLSSEVKLRDQESVLAIDHKLQAFCVDMHRVGMHLDRKAQNAHATRLFKEQETARVELVRAAVALGMPNTFNPGSTQQMAALLFDRLRLPWDPEWETETGNQGTSMEVIRELLVHPSVQPASQKILTLVHKFRRAQKFLGTYVMDSKSADGDGLVVHPDGRVHWSYNVAGTVSGRFSGPSMTLPRKLRDMYCAAPGHVLVGADMDQIELRMISAVGGLSKYLKVFASDDRSEWGAADPHALTADLLYGPAWRTRPHDEAKKLRDFGKRFSFGCAYGAGTNTVWKVLRGTEGDDGGFPYLNVSEGKVEADRAKWLSGVPELPVYWNAAVSEWRQQTYLRDPVLGRRRDFLNGEDRNEIVNYKIQAGAVGVVHTATLDMIENDGLKLNFDGQGTGIIGQFHDALLVECRESSAERVKSILTSRMNRTVEGLPVKFSSTAKAGHSWRDV